MSDGGRHRTILGDDLLAPTSSSAPSTSTSTSKRHRVASGLATAAGRSAAASAAAGSLGAARGAAAAEPKVHVKQLERALAVLRHADRDQPAPIATPRSIVYTVQKEGWRRVEDRGSRASRAGVAEEGDLPSVATSLAPLALRRLAPLALQMASLAMSWWLRYGVVMLALLLLVLPKFAAASEAAFGDEEEEKVAEEADEEEDEEEAAEEEDEEEDYEDGDGYYHPLSDMPPPAAEVTTGFTVVSHAGEIQLGDEVEVICGFRNGGEEVSACCRRRCCCCAGAGATAPLGTRAGAELDTRS